MGEILTQQEFEDILRRVREALDEVPKQYQRLVENIKAVLRTLQLAESVIQQIMSALAAVRNVIDKVVAEVGKFVTQPGVPWTLWDRGSTWTEQVGGKASNWQDVFTLGTMRTDDEWKGAAADTYKGMLWLQPKALGAVKAASDEVDDALTKMAIAVGVAWLAIISGLVSFGIELTAEAGAAATVVGAPAAAAGAAVSAGKLWGIVAAALAVLEAFVASSLVPAMKDLTQRIRNSEGLPHGHWPRLTADMSDSSHRENRGQNPAWEMSKA